MASPPERDSQFRVRVLSDTRPRGKRVITVEAIGPLPAALAAFERISSSPPTVVDVLSLHEPGRFEVVIEAASGVRHRFSVSHALD